MPVTRGQIVAAALDLLDEAGLDGLTLRQLAGRLASAPPRCTGMSGTSANCSTCWRPRSWTRRWPPGGSRSRDSRGGSGSRPGPGSCARRYWPTATARGSSPAIGRPSPACPASSGNCGHWAAPGFTPRDGLLALLALNAYVIGDVIDQQADGTRQRPAPTKPLPSAEPPAVAREPVIPATPVPATEPGAPVGSEGPDGGAGTPPGIGPDGPYPLLSAAIGGVSSPDQRFEHGLGALVAGLRTRHAE